MKYLLISILIIFSSIKSFEIKAGLTLEHQIIANMEYQTDVLITFSHFAHNADKIHLKFEWDSIDIAEALGKEYTLTSNSFQLSIENEMSNISFTEFYVFIDFYRFFKVTLTYDQKNIEQNSYLNFLSIIRHSRDVLYNGLFEPVENLSVTSRSENKKANLEASVEDLGSIAATDGAEGMSVQSENKSGTIETNYAKFPGINSSQDDNNDANYLIKTWKSTQHVMGKRSLNNSNDDKTTDSEREIATSDEGANKQKLSESGKRQVPILKKIPRVKDLRSSFDLISPRGRNTEKARKEGITGIENTKSAEQKVNLTKTIKGNLLKKKYLDFQYLAKVFCSLSFRGKDYEALKNSFTELLRDTVTNNLIYKTFPTSKVDISLVKRISLIHI
jgi:hypothetical protein